MESLNSETIRRTLERTRVRYKTEYPLPNGLRFDYAIFSGSSYQDLVLLIEYDGSQHYDPSSGFFTEAGVERDRQKEAWCSENKIPLLRLRESEFPSPGSITNFLESKVIPLLPESSFNHRTDFDLEQFQQLTHKSRARLIPLDSLDREWFSIKALADLLDYSPSYLTARIRQSFWFKNWSGRTNLTTTPFEIHREDVYRGLVELGFLLDTNGNQILAYDPSRAKEDLYPESKTVPTQIALVVYGTDTFTVPDEPLVLDLLQACELRISRIDSIGALVRLGIDDRVARVWLQGGLTEEERSIVEESFGEKLLRL